MMRLGIVLSTQPSSFSAIPFKEGIAENISKIKKLGFDGIEMAVRNPEQLNVDWLISLPEENSMTVPAIQTGQVFLEEGLSFVNPDPKVRRRAIERIKSHVRLAKKLDALVIIGLVRGEKAKDTSDEEADIWLFEALRECGGEDTSVKLVVEPINRWYPGAGHIDFAELVDTLKQVDYQGFVSAEIMAFPDPDTAAMKTIEYMRKLIPAQNQ